MLDVRKLVDERSSNYTRDPLFGFSRKDIRMSEKNLQEYVANEAKSSNDSEDDRFGEIAPLIGRDKSIDLGLNWLGM